MRLKIKWVHWAWLLLTLFFLFFRLQNFQGVFTSQGVIVNDTDPYYRLHRINTMLSENRIYPLHEDKLNYPKGLEITWPLGLDLLVSLPLKLYNATKRIEIESFAAIVIPFLSLPLLWFAGWLGTSMGGPLLGILLGLLITCSSTLIYQTGLGRLDHHFIEATLPIMLLMFLRSYLQFPKKFHFVGIVTILGLASSFAPHGWIFGLLTGVGLLISKDWKNAHRFSIVFFVSFLISLVPLSFSDRFANGYVNWGSFSWWTPLVYITTAFLFEIVHLTFNKVERTTRWFTLVVKVCFIFVFSFLTYKNTFSFFQTNVTNSIKIVTVKETTMATTQEAKSPLTLSLNRLVHSDTDILVISTVCFLFFAFRRKHLFLLGYAAIPILLSFFQIRFLTMSMSLMMLIILLFFQDYLEKIPFSKIKRQIILAIICIAIIVPFRPYFGFTSISNTHYYFWPIRIFSQFLNHEFERRGEIKKDQSILAHWDYGHWLLYYTGLPVIANPFQGEAAIDGIRLFSSHGTDELEPFLKKYPTRYLVLESGAQRSLSWIETGGKNKELYFEKVGVVDGQDHFKTTPIFEDLFMYRFFFELGLGLDNNHPKNWRLIYISPFPSPVEKDLPALKVFEYVPGVTFNIHTKRPYKELYLQAEVFERDDALMYQQVAKGTQDFSWTVPYGIYNQGSVRFDGTYTIRDSDGKKLYTISKITEKQVLAGETVKIQF
jgi:asparagine N-glycosylation enzyme membrane subunit Stt3